MIWKYNLVVFTFILLQLNISSTAQEAEEFNNDALAKDIETVLSFQVGMGNIGMRDHTISSFAYNGGCYGGNMGFTRKEQSFRYGFNLGLYFSTPTTKMRDGYTYEYEFTKDTVNGINGSEVPMTLFDFNANLLFKLNKNTESNWSMWAGAKLDYLKMSKKFLILDHQNSTSESYFTLNPMLLLEFKPHSRHSFHYSIDFSLVGHSSKSDYYNAKPDYYKNDNFIPMYSESGFATFNNLLVANSTLGYRFQIGNHIALTADYTFSYYRYTKPLEVRMVRQNFQLGMSVLF